ncbi:Zinc carboxypeptidase [Carpediemonas membranifera]|uniref:Zinc carboxypeptidase n=1 Tax=Carpediemonas membranifera TaxID=201153 RepID=A0A8J6BA71_9EUKA|nr:Zinc carboxypeptidase [Carpediemonas membranifera]|eukprot:KAG9397354.1 Zinc carboxypeptidase [Carpediemonas membranifera]
MSKQFSSPPLTFDCAFESGNIGKVVRTETNAYDIYIRPDTYQEKWRLWFYFRVTGVRAGESVCFSIMNINKKATAYRLGMSPIVRSTSRPKWERIPEKYCFNYTDPRGKAKNPIVSFLFKFDNERDEYFFAFCYPYTYSMLQRFLSRVTAAGLPYFHRAELTQTLMSKTVDLLTITDPAVDDSGKKVVLITARVHPGETPASFVCHSVIEFLISSGPIPEALRRAVVFKIVPMMNPDGVYWGNYRTNGLGHDLNRKYLAPRPDAHPVISAVRRLVRALYMDEALPLPLEPDVVDSTPLENAETRLALVVDLHAHSNCTGAFFYYNANKNDPVRDAAEKAYPTIVGRLSRPFAAGCVRASTDSGKDGTMRRTLENLLEPSPFTYTCEVSCFGGLLDGTTSGRKEVYTPDSYMQIGRDLMVGLAEYLSLDVSGRS